VNKFIICIVLFTLADSSVEITKEEVEIKCIEKSNFTDRAMSECTKKEVLIYEQRLEVIYQKLLTKLKVSKRDELKKAQSLWFKYRKINC